MELNSAHITQPQILFGKVMHKRLFPKVNQFTYGIYYLVLPLSKIGKSIENSYLKYNRFGLISFYNKDHGDRDGSNLRAWAGKILTDQNVKGVDGEIVLVALPRILGYVFNPVSFWYCYDKTHNLRAVICEVNNTFGETHTYVCEYDENDRVGTKDQVMEADKVFHVSPFLTRDGGYRFRFAMDAQKMGAWIDYFHTNGQKQLLTALSGTFQDLDRKSCGRAFWRYPLVTFKAIFLIHWQAVKLFVKKVEYVPKPKQIITRVTKTQLSQTLVK